MPTNNGLTLANKAADIEIENAAGDIYGFPVQAPTIPEDRASRITEGTGEAAPTIKSAGPFETMEVTDWSYGYGQTNMDRAEGGALGQGGNPAQYFYGDCFSLRPGKLLPGMARDQIYNQAPTALSLPMTDNLDPNVADECEVPRGVLPVSLGSGPQSGANFTSPVAVTTVTNVRLLIYFEAPQLAGNVTITAEIKTTPGGLSKGIYSLVTAKNVLGNYTGWKWLTLPLSSGTGQLGFNTAHVLTVTCSDTTGLVSGGCYIGAGNAVRLYFQLMTSGTPFKYWASQFGKIEQLNNAGAYVNVAVEFGTASGAFFNTGATGTGGTVPANSPEITFASKVTGSYVFGNQLYVSGNFGTYQMTAAQAASNTLGALGALQFGWGITDYNGMIYYTDASGQVGLRTPGQALFQLPKPGSRTGHAGR
jgi:hypothetical protein